MAEAIKQDAEKSRVEDRKSTRLNSSHGYISYAVFCLKKKKKKTQPPQSRRNVDAIAQARPCSLSRHALSLVHLVSPLSISVASFLLCFFFFFNDTATTEIYTLSLHDALPILPGTVVMNGAGHKFLARAAFT